MEYRDFLKLSIQDVSVSRDLFQASFRDVRIVLPEILSWNYLRPGFQEFCGFLF
jgi:hypothetical protein